jgi:hypothetical protein
MSTLLHVDPGSRVEQEEGLVRKTILGLNKSGLRGGVCPEEMTEREIRALQTVNNVPHVQKFVRIGETSNSFYSEYVSGTHLGSYSGQLPKEFFDRLQNSLRTCRERGVYRLDRFLHAERDIIVRPDLTPGILDFGNVLFFDDQIARVPGIKQLLEKYAFLQDVSLRRRYQGNLMKKRPSKIIFN